MARKLGLSRQQVIDAAVTIADRDGIEGVSLAAVATAVGARAPSLYAHVNGSTGLRNAVALEAARALADSMTKAVRRRQGADALRATAYAYRHFATRHRGLYSSLHTTPAADEVPEVFAAFAAPIQPILGAFADLGAAPADRIALVRTLRSALHGFVTLEASGGFGLPEDIDASFDVLVDTLIAGITARAISQPQQKSTVGDRPGQRRPRIGK